MIADPERRGRSLASFYRAVAPRLWSDVQESGALPVFGSNRAALLAEREWECFALYACVRGLVAAGGFNRETAVAIDAMHASILEGWREESAAPDPFEPRRARISERYAEYGAIGQEGGAAGAATVGTRLGAACARHVAGEGAAEALASLLGEIHESIAAGAAETVKLEE